MEDFLSMKTKNVLSYQPKETITQNFDEGAEERSQEPEEPMESLIGIQENIQPITT